MEKLKYSKAIVFEKPRKVNFRDIELTPVTKDSIVCKTVMSGISSGTDMKTWRGEQSPEKVWFPLVPGYENAGEVVYVGPDSEFADTLKVGDRVMINECRQFANVCAAWGGSSLYVVKNSFTAPASFDGVAKIPDNVSYKDAVLAYLATVALKGIERIPLKPNYNVLVTGAGMIGISAIQILKILYPEVKVICIDKNSFRRSIAEKFADFVLAPDESHIEKIKSLTDGKMADAVVECTGDPSIPGILHKYIKDGGWDSDHPPAHIHLQGDYPDKIIMDHYHYWFVKNCTITMTCALKRGGKEQILKWISEGKFDTKSLPVEVWPVKKCAEAYEYKQKNGENVFKILFDWKEV